MSKRGKRRNSKRRKSSSSSSSSKQSVSTYICQKQNKSNSVCYKDDLAEKGETDSLRKENVLSGSDKEGRFEQEDHITPFPNQIRLYTKTTEDGENGIKIVTSVSFSDVDESCPKIMFQQSQEKSSSPVTNVMEVDCTGSNVKLEIQEIPHVKAPGIKATVVVVNDKGNGETCLRDIEKSSMPNSDFFEGPLHKVTSRNGNRNTSYRFTFGSRREQTKAQGPESWESPSDCRCCCHRKRQTPADVLLTDDASGPPVLLNIQPHARSKQLHGSVSGDQGWHIPPPQEFADKPKCFEDLTQDLACCTIGPSDEQRGEFHSEYDLSCRNEAADAVEDVQRADVAPSFDQLSESGNYEPTFMRGSMSTNRSSFTKDFINCQKRKSWIRNNSIATVEHRACRFPKKRRQTFPGMSKGVGLMQEDLILPYGESFSSLFMCSLHLSTERPGRSLHGNEKFPASGTGGDQSSQTKGSSEPPSEMPSSQVGKQPLFSPFYMTSSEDNVDDVFAVSQQYRQTSFACNPAHLRQEYTDLKRSAPKELDSSDDCAYTADQGEIADSGFDQEMGHVDHHSPEPLTEELSQQGLAVHVLPPSCSGSQEQMLQNHPGTWFHNSSLENAAKEDCISVAPKRRKSLVTTTTAGDVEQRFMPVDSLEIYATALEDHSRAHSFNADELKERTEPEAPRGTTGNSCPSPRVLPEEASHHITEDSDKPAASVCTDAEVQAKEQLRKTGKAGKALVSSSSSETRAHLKPVIHKDPDSGGSDRWAKRRKLFKETKQWSSAGGSSVTSDVTEESVSEDTRRWDMTLRGDEDGGFYTETFHASAWIYHGDDAGSGPIPPSLNARSRVVSIRERTVSISKGTGEYPWGFRIQFSKPIVVTEVDTNGAAEEAGLTVGDFVLAVNGTDVTSIPHSEAAALARQGPDVLTLTIGSDIARCPNTPWPACRGYLHKRTQSGLIRGWRKRWFVLAHDCCLYYYRHKRDEGKRRPLSAVKLEGAEVGQDTSLGKPFVFKCRPLSAHRVYFFCATSSQEMKRWLEAMQKAMHPVTQKHVWVDVTRHNSSLPPLAVKSPECLGLLHKADRSRDTWVQYYCVLKDACLYLYSGIRATHAHGGLYLQGYTVREQPYGSKKSSIELKPPFDEFKTFYLCAENPSENKRWIGAIKASVKRWLPLHQALQDYMNRPPEETRM